MLYCNFDTIITGSYKLSNNNMHIKQFDCNKLNEHIATSTAKTIMIMNSKSKKLIYFSFGQISEASLATRNTVRSSKVCTYFQNIFPLQRCWDSWMLAMNNTERSGIATVQYKHSANRSDIKHQGCDGAGLKEFSNIVSLIKSQHY